MAKLFLANISGNISSAVRNSSNALRQGLGWQEGDPDGPAVRLLDDDLDRADPAGDALLDKHLAEADSLHAQLRRGGGLPEALPQRELRELDALRQDVRSPTNARIRDIGRPHIHPLACVDPKAEIGDGTVIGPFCVIGPDVVIGRNNKLTNNVTVSGHTTVGDHNLFHPGCCIGTEPQDMKYRGEPTRTEIGDFNCFREHVTIHGGTVKGGGVTTVGDYNLLMVGSHLGHDVRWGSHTVLANHCMIAGHCIGQDGVSMMGGAAVHHFTTLGAYSYIAGYSRITMDVPPFVKVQDDNRVRGLNRVGLERRGFGGGEIAALERAVRTLWNRRSKTSFGENLAQIERHNASESVARLTQFLRRRNQGVHGRYLESLR
jgi:UDP-N-acetylglucosamine acyltransferase